MKKIFAFVAVAMMALSASADVIWSEDFGAEATKNDKGYWPYAGGDASKNYVYTDYSNDYDKVSSYNVSVRAKSVGADQSVKYNGFYFGAGKAAAECYVTFEKTGLIAAQESMYLKFDFMSDQIDVVDLSKIVLKVNDNVMTVPNVATTAKYYTKTAVVALPNEAVNSISFAFDNIDKQIFMLNIRVEDNDATAFETVKAGVKAEKVIENGQIVIIRNGVRFNAAGARL